MQVLCSAADRNGAASVFWVGRDQLRSEDRQGAVSKLNNIRPTSRLGNVDIAPAQFQEYEEKNFDYEEDPNTQNNIEKLNNDPDFTYEEV